MSGFMEMLTFIFEIFLRVTSVIYDYISVLPFYLINQPHKVLERSAAVKAVSLNPSDPAGPYRNVDVDELLYTPFEGCRSVKDVFNFAVEKYKTRECLGTRRLVKDEDEVQPNGKVFKKSIFGPYEWQTYEEVAERVTNFANGLLSLGFGSDLTVCTFSETCSHWTLTALACFTHKFPLITLYATLGEDAILYGLKETDVDLIVTSVEGISKFKSIHTKLSNLKAIIYFDGTPGRDANDSVKLSPEVVDYFKVPVIPFSRVESLGERSVQDIGNADRDIKPSDLALIMYTSGSTGNPKGVMISHSNLLASITGAIHSAAIGVKDRYAAYLPQAHILELMAELSCFVSGARIGFSSPSTLTDFSTRIKKGSRGDISVLKPTLMAMVPAIMDRVYKSVWDKVNSRNPFRKVIFKWAYEYKKKWYLAGYSTPLVNLFVFKRLRHVVLGGNVRIILCGSAPLNEDTQLFMNICMCCPIGQGFGLTETTALGSVQQAHDMSIGRVGVPVSSSLIKLVPWEEGGYTPQDKPHPRGEVWIGGHNVTLGYYKDPVKTQEEFKEEGGMRWFATGDIGCIEEDGSLRIIDRKKDLVKLQAGEYVSLGKVEVVLRMCQYVDHVCVCALSNQNFPVALVMPNPKVLVRLANQLQVLGADVTLSEDDWLQVVDNKEVVASVLADMKSVAAKGKLQKFEVPQKIKLVKEQWSAIDGFVTESFKLKRKFIGDYYKQDINNLYSI